MLVHEIQVLHSEISSSFCLTYHEDGNRNICQNVGTTSITCSWTPAAKAKQKVEFAHLLKHYTVKVYNWMLWLSLWHSCFMFGRSWGIVSTWRPATLVQ